MTSCDGKNGKCPLQQAASTRLLGGTVPYRTRTSEVATIKICTVVFCGGCAFSMGPQLLFGNR